MENKLAIEVAKNLLKIKAVFLKPNDPFTWASGIKSPIYCDNRLTLSYPETRKVVEQGLAEIIKKYYPTCEVIMGTSTAGIAHAAYVSDILDMPMGYVRGGAKDHGRGNQIEGVVPVGKDVVVIEDVQYQIKQVQHKQDTFPFTSLLSLEKLEEDYDDLGIR